MYLCDLGTLITESHISFFCRSASRGGFFSGEHLKKPKNGRSNDHRHSKKCENDHRIGGQFCVFLKSSPLKNPPLYTKCNTMSFSPSENAGPLESLRCTDTGLAPSRRRSWRPPGRSRSTRSTRRRAAPQRWPRSSRRSLRRWRCSRCCGRQTH